MYVYWPFPLPCGIIQDNVSLYNSVLSAVQLPKTSLELERVTEEEILLNSETNDSMSNCGDKLMAYILLDRFVLLFQKPLQIAHLLQIKKPSLFLYPRFSFDCPMNQHPLILRKRQQALFF